MSQKGCVSLPEFILQAEAPPAQQTHLFPSILQENRSKKKKKKTLSGLGDSEKSIVTHNDTNRFVGYTKLCLSLQLSPAKDQGQETAETSQVVSLLPLLDDNKVSSV